MTHEAMYDEYMQHGPLYVTTEDTQKLPILIVDREGVLGTELARKLQDQFLVVLVTGKSLEVQENIIHIPYRKKIPVIPDNTYSHIFLIYHGDDALLDMLPSFVSKATLTQAQILFVTSFLHCTPQFTRKVAQHRFHSVRWLVYGELFDNRGLEANILNAFIHQVRVYGKITIPNSGLGRHHPILLDDVLMAIIATAFVEEQKQQIMLAFPKYAVSELSLARMLQKMNPLIKIDFKKKKNRAVAFAIPEGEYLFPDYSVEERLRQISLKKDAVVSENAPKKILLPGRRKKRNKVFLCFLLLILVIILPLLLTFGLLSAGGALLHLSFSQLEKQELPLSQRYAHAAGISFSLAEASSGMLGGIRMIVPGYVQQTQEYIETGKQLAAIESEIFTSVMTLQEIAAKKSTDPKNDFMHSLATLKNALLTLQKLQAENRLPEEVSRKLAHMQDVLTLFENTSDTYPQLFGFDGSRKYALLFQNNMELRPGGGFIGSYAIVEIKDGKITRFKIYDVYDADGQLKTHVEPPFALRRYLGAAHWYLRDSNFSLDFIDNAKAASRFLIQETNEQVDGVIAVDTSFLRSVIGALGSLSVSGYPEKVTADNFYLVTQTQAEKDFFPGSTQKKDFLSALADALYLRLTGGESIPVAAMLASVEESIAGKHVLFAFPDTATQEVFTVNNLSGSLWDGRKPEKETFPDYLGVIDANIGANKANYYVTRSLKQSVVIDDEGDITTTVTAVYENDSKKESAFGGDYKNYVRFIIPSNASLASVAINEKPIATTDAITDPAVFTKKSFVPPTGLELERTEIAGKTAIGLLLLVPTESRKTISITYTIPRAISVSGTSFTYSLRLFKQPGANDDPYTFFLSYPPSYRPVEMNDAISDVGGKVSYFTTLGADTELSILFSKQ